MAVTAYTPSPALGSDDTNTGTNFRVLVKLAAASNGQIRVRFRSSSSGGLNIIGAGFGKWDGNALSASSSDMTTAPFRLTFSASNGVNIGSNSTVTSDFITHTGLTLNSGDWLIVTFYADTVANQRFSTGHTTATTMFKAVQTDHSQTQTAATMGGSLSIIGNVQPGGSGGYNYSVDLVETNDGATVQPLTGSSAARVSARASAPALRVALSGTAASVSWLKAKMPTYLLGTAGIRAAATSILTQQSITTSEPVLASAASTAYNTGATPKSATGISVQNGDVILAYGMMEVASGDILSVSTSSGSTTSWTLLADVPGSTTNSQAYLRAWSATATATGTISVDFARSGGLNNAFGGTVKVYRNSGGIGAVQPATNGTGSGLPSISITTTRDRSVLDFASDDWNVATGTATFTSSAGAPAEDLNILMSGLHRVYSAHVNAGNAGSKTVGMSAPSGQRYVAVAIEVFGLGQIGSLVARAGISARGKSVLSGAVILAGKASSAAAAASTFSGRLSLSGAARIATRAGLFSQVVILAMQTRFMPAMRGVLTTTVFLGSSAGSVFRFTGKGDGSGRTGLAGKTASTTSSRAGGSAASALSGRTAAAARAGATAAGRVILEIQTRFSPAMRGALNAAVVPTGIALAASAAAMSRVKAAITGATALQGAVTGSSRATGGFLAIAALAGRTASKAAGLASMARQSAMVAAAAIKASVAGSMVGRASLFGRAAMATTARFGLPSPIVAMAARVATAARTTAALVAGTALSGRSAVQARASMQTASLRTFLAAATKTVGSARAAAVASASLATSGAAKIGTVLRAKFSGATSLAGQTSAAVRTSLGGGFASVAARTAVRVVAKALLFVLAPVIPTPVNTRPGRLSRLNASLLKAFGEEFDIAPMTQGVDVNTRFQADSSRAQILDVSGIWDGPTTSRTPTARGALQDDNAHNWNVSYPSANFDDGLVAGVRKGDVLTRRLDGAVYEIVRVVPNGFGRTTLQLSKRKRS